MLPQAVLGSPHWPWQPIGEADARAAIEVIDAVGPAIVALSGHHSTAWTYDAFHQAFGERYRTLRAGELLVISRDGIS